MIKTQDFIYEGDGKTYQGVLAFDDSHTEKRPAVMVSHTWSGQSQFETDKAIALAEQGYLALAIDVYGKGKRAKDATEAEELMMELQNDRQELLNRLLLSLNAIKKHELADAAKIGIIGFCFGGKCALDLARSGVAIKASVCFHGIFDPPGLEQEEEVDIKAKILVLHGWEDPFAFPKDIAALGYELTERNAIWEIDVFGHTGHAFTNPNANAPDDGMMYNPLATDRSWLRMSNFFEEVFAD
ncbi:dienelactone hydrolase family protein [Flagellimonas zhangzhouensis]|uniref:Dienelactone hydrolase n=1 Tax=Flagellimonas zhangzhouensis TaxID=1073328 RepID=A0A1H2Y0J8_9FLAO|nr:dienelactone hydrolase family protein [Allomuricauda zhangzhouensis]SDQ93480.1 Dienelactone hydrolase [Allomuricauda zhangzhouensis]SDW98129.1 Dienelactone hydrolase [Allomuricauda zhangzhouensis]